MVVGNVRGRLAEEGWMRGGAPGTAKGLLAERPEGSPERGRKFRERSDRVVSKCHPRGCSAGTFPEWCRNARRFRNASRGLFEEECLKFRNDFGSGDVPAEPCGSRPEARTNMLVHEGLLLGYSLFDRAGGRVRTW